jgi:hypothetical protein
MRRMAVTGTGLSTAALPAAVSGVPSSACKIDELLIAATGVDQFHGENGARSPHAWRFDVRQSNALNVPFLRPQSR